MVFTPTHGHARAILHGKRTPLYITWEGMIQRCTNSNSPNWCYYGALGVKVCERWRTFENFMVDMGPRPAGKTLDRFPNKNGDYQPGNCRWATRKEQQNNRRPSRKRKPLLTFNGESLSAGDWGIKLGGKRNFIINRLRRGMTFEEAVTTPPQRRLTGWCVSEKSE